MNEKKNLKRSEKYMNPYLAGVFLGLVLLSAYYISGRGLGASGAVKSTVVSAVESLAPGHAAKAPYYREYRETHPGNPLRNWLVATSKVHAAG